MKWDTIKPKRKSDIVMLIFFALLLWTLASQLKDWILFLSLDYLQIGSWFRVLATSVAIIGSAWMFRVYLKSVREGKDKSLK